MYSRIAESVAQIRTRCKVQPSVGLILGSGLGSYADSLQERTVLPFGEIPHFPVSTVPGHSGNLISAVVQGVPVVALQGRIHLYEGYSMAEVAFPARVLGCLGIHGLIVTNAAGGINEDFRPGDWMLITDHINLMGANPLTGANLDEFGPRFPDMSEAYAPHLLKVALEVAREVRMSLQQGVYAGLCGPSYETPAEIRMLRALGADSVGMSTIPEVLIAGHMGIPVLGISCITNMAAGIFPQKITHQEVIDTAERSKESFAALLNGIIPRLAAE